MAQLTQAARKLMRDPAFRFFGESVTYRILLGTSTVDRGTGIATPDNDDTVIGADSDNDPGVLIGPVTESMINKSGGSILPDDIVIRIRTSDLPENPPTITSKILSGSNTYDIMSHTVSADLNVFILVGRKV